MKAERPSLLVVDDDARRKKGLEETRRVMDMLQQVGGKRLAAPPAGATDQADLSLLKAAERYRELLELGERFGIRAARLRDFGCDLSKIEKPPSQRSRPDGLERFPVEKSASVGAVETKRAGKRNLRVIVRNCNTDSLVRRGKSALGCNDVGSAA